MDRLINNENAVCCSPDNYITTKQLHKTATKLKKYKGYSRHSVCWQNVWKKSLDRGDIEFWKSNNKHEGAVTTEQTTHCLRPQVDISSLHMEH